MYQSDRLQNTMEDQQTLSDITPHTETMAASVGNQTDLSMPPGDGPRHLTVEEHEKLNNDRKVVTEFKQQKLEKEALKNWDLFYKRNTTKFFKDRHWTTREFEELCGKKTADRLTVLEVGCGVGNFIFPLIQECPNIFFYACDFSPRAVQFVKDNPMYSTERCHAFQNDLTCDPLRDSVPPGTVDIVSMIFVLSAIHPDKMVQALSNIFSVLRPGGSVLIRDYGLYDHAMLRFAPGQKLSDNFYVRQDGTRAYYFTTEMMASLFKEAGFSTTHIEYILRETVNKKEGLCVPRVFIQGKFTKPDSDTCIHENQEPLVNTCVINKDRTSQEHKHCTPLNNDHVTSLPQDCTYSPDGSTCTNSHSPGGDTCTDSTICTQVTNVCDSNELEQEQRNLSALNQTETK